jgi:hypothetical protein
MAGFACGGVLVARTLESTQANRLASSTYRWKQFNNSSVAKSLPNARKNANCGTATLSVYMIDSERVSDRLSKGLLLIAFDDGCQAVNIDVPRSWLGY